jgi:outer membrane lipoprotein-sorting protein
MSRKTLLACAAAAALALPAAAQTVDEIIAKNVEARGGMKTLKAASTVRMTGRMTVGPGLEAPFVIEQKRPARMRLDITFQGMTGTQAYDGTSAWMVMPFMGKKDPERVPDEDAQAFAEQADFDGILVDYKAKGHAVELLGKEPVEGSEAYKLKVTMKDGAIRYVYIDAEAFLEIRTEGKRKIRGSEVEGESSIGDYKEVAGMMMPHAVESGAKGSPQKQKITIDKIEVNVPIDDARFVMPEVKKEEPAPPKQ